MRIFVSSTFRDLSPARELAARAITSFGHVSDLADSMEGMSDSAIVTALRCRVYVADALFLIVGFAKGSAPRMRALGESTYTHVEVKAALDAGLPVRAFYLHPNAAECITAQEFSKSWFRMTEDTFADVQHRECSDLSSLEVALREVLAGYPNPK